MRLEDVTAEIRPRSDWEAVDLGFAMVRRDFWRCLMVWWLAVLPLLLVAAWFLRDKPLLLTALFWWWKPFGSRLVLFELSRRLFGEKPTWKSVSMEIPKAWVRRFFYRMLIARLSPWLPVAIAVEDLEGLRGARYRQRMRQISRRGNSVMMWLYSATDFTAVWLGLSLFAAIVLLLPEGHDGPWKTALETFDKNHPFDIPLVISWTVAGCTMVAMSLVDLFLTGAGFGIYVNNRTWLEGWDVELAFKRIGQRLGKIAASILLTLSIGFLSCNANADEAVRNAEMIREIKANPDFIIHSETHKIPKSKGKSSSSTSTSTSGFKLPPEIPMIIGYSMLGALLVFLLWIIWLNRHVFHRSKRSSDIKNKNAPTARMVMGMEVTAQSLPKDVPTAAWALWTDGRHHEALSLLYRGTIFKVINEARVDIYESDTEGDCVRRVEGAGEVAYPKYFKTLTAIWMQLAYAAKQPQEAEVRELCDRWPFRERRIV